MSRRRSLSSRYQVAIEILMAAVFLLLVLAPDPGHAAATPTPPASDSTLPHGGVDATALTAVGAFLALVGLTVLLLVLGGRQRRGAGPQP